MGGKSDASHAEVTQGDSNVVTALAGSLSGQERTVRPVLGTRFADLTDGNESAGAEVIELPTNRFFRVGLWTTPAGVGRFLPEFPAMTRTEFGSEPIRSDTDLTTRWADMMGGGSFGRRSLWLICLDDRDVVLPVVVPIDDIPADPDPLVVRNLGAIATDVIATSDAASVAFLLSRPGPAAMSAGDRSWARLLHDVLVARGLARWPIHLATRDLVRVFAPDDLT